MGKIVRGNFGASRSETVAFFLPDFGARTGSEDLFAPQPIRPEALDGRKRRRDRFISETEAKG